MLTLLCSIPRKKGILGLGHLPGNACTHDQEEAIGDVDDGIGCRERRLPHDGGSVEERLDQAKLTTREKRSNGD
jgi:hypothetical protein